MAEQLLLNSIPGFKNINVFIKNPIEVERKLLVLIQGGLKQLQIITDFDETITKQKIENGENKLTSIGVLHTCPSFPDSYKTISKTLYEKYHPFEIDNTLDKTKKTSIMLKWWQEESAILKNFRLAEKEFQVGTKNSIHKIRNNTYDMLKYANDYKIPVLVFSAGIGNAIVAILKTNEMMFENVSIVSNFLKYTNQDILDGFQEPLIHILNKNEYILKKSNYEILQKRPNFLLLGDCIGDADMAVDRDDRTILRIGFVMKTDKVTFEQFSNQFDILLIDDQTMSIPFNILKIIPNT